MTIEKLSDYIKGYDYTRKASAPYRAEADLFNKVYNMVEHSSTAKSNLRATRRPSVFYKHEPDIAHYVPKPAQEEMYFALKNGFISREVPAKAIHKILLAYEKYKMPNLIFKCISDAELKVMFQENYLAEGVTYTDVICSFVDEKYTPLSSSTKKVDYEDYSEVYIMCEDMVAAVPRDISDSLSNSDISELKVDNYGIHLNGVYLRGLGGFYGASRSTYDLRHCV